MIGMDLGPPVQAPPGEHGGVTEALTEDQNVRDYRVSLRYRIRCG